jgi:catechol 2,3-dioxygenase-like lactoylglutathione lyase family enzyme
LDHMGFLIGDLKVSRKFYDRALASLGIRVLMEVTAEMTGGDESHLGYGADRAFFWIGNAKKTAPQMPVAVAAEYRKIVDAFYAAALVGGGRDNGKPGVRPEYHEHSYGAYVLDPDGNNLEAVCHRPLTDQQG